MVKEFFLGHNCLKNQRLDVDLDLLHDVLIAMVLLELVFTLKVGHEKIAGLSRVARSKDIVPKEILNLQEEIDYEQRINKIYECIADVTRSLKVHW